MKYGEAGRQPLGNEYRLRAWSSHRYFGIPNSCLGMKPESARKGKELEKGQKYIGIDVSKEMLDVA